MIIISIDPGQNGGIVVTTTGGDTVGSIKMPPTITDIVDIIVPYTDENPYLNTSVKVFIEEQAARPAYRKQKDKATGKDELTPIRGAVASWTFAQHYGELRGIIAALRLHVVYVKPKAWMKELGIPAKKKTESQTQWKNSLKAKAQELFPQVKVTLWNADALLLNEYGKRIAGVHAMQETPAEEDLSEWDGI